MPLCSLTLILNTADYDAAYIGGDRDLRNTASRRSEAAICLTCSGVWVRALFAYGTRSAVRRSTTPVGNCNVKPFGS